MFAALAMKDERVLSKLDKFIAFAPVAFVNHQGSELLNYLLNS